MLLTVVIHLASEEEEEEEEEEVGDEEQEQGREAGGGKTPEIAVSIIVAEEEGDGEDEAEDDDEEQASPSAAQSTTKILGDAGETSTHELDAGEMSGSSDNESVYPAADRPRSPESVAAFPSAEPSQESMLDSHEQDGMLTGDMFTIGYRIAGIVTLCQVVMVKKHVLMRIIVLSNYTHQLLTRLVCEETISTRATDLLN